MRSRYRYPRRCAALLLMGLGLFAVGGCSTSGRELPVPTTTTPPVPQIVATVTTR